MITRNLPLVHHATQRLPQSRSDPELQPHSLDRPSGTCPTVAAAGIKLVSRLITPRLGFSSTNL